ARQWQYLRGDGLLEHIQEATLDIAEQGGLPFRA
ncbi:hypothetical protein WJX84_007351, partial [Apatococcus fuscideae]